MNSHYTRYYLVQSGGNLADIGEVYRSPLIYQRGKGIGSLFSGLLRYLQPVFTSGAKALKQQALKTGKAILQEVGSKPITNILKEQGKAAAQELAQKCIDKLFDSMGGADANSRMLIKRRNPFATLHLPSAFKRKRRSKSKKSPKKTVKKTKSKRKLIKKPKKGKRVLDIFDK